MTPDEDIFIVEAKPGFDPASAKLLQQMMNSSPLKEKLIEECEKAMDKYLDMLLYGQEREKKV